MVRPVGLIDDIQGQSQSVDNTLKQFETFANNFGKETAEEQRHQIDSKAFYELVMKRGRE